MDVTDRERLRAIKTFPSLVKYLRDELDWPIESDHFDDLTFDWELGELGIDLKNTAIIKTIKQLRPLETNQPWGIFFIKFEPKRLPVVALRRILSSLAVKKRTSAKRSEQPAWRKNDLLFISAYGEDDNRHITFAHFSESPETGDLPVLRVLGWDGSDTPLHIDHVHHTLTDKLRWPDDTEDIETWRVSWSSAFTLRHREVITTSKQLAVRLADLAKDIRRRVNSVLDIETKNGPMRKLMKAFKEALIHDLDEDDFADMYAQTIAYGLLTARVSRPAGLTADNLTDMVPITNPFLKELMETFLHIGGRRNSKGKRRGLDFDELGVNEVVETLRAARMEDVLRDFGDRNPAEDPVIHFYELFLKEYDAKKRMQRGVFYTPRPVVSFIVRSVDEILRTEFGLKDGLADTATWGEMAKKHKGLELPRIVPVKKPDSPDVEYHPIPRETPFVQILDPACGTGTFLVEVIHHIYKTMVAKWKGQGKTELYEIPKLWNEYVPRHLLPRLYGFELMMAPYAIAHMKIGLKLFETGYTFGSDERARIYLTNSLEPPHDFSDTFEQMAPALAHEANAANEVKTKVPSTVVIGNPPYAIHSANLSARVRSIVDRYRSCGGKPIRERGALQFEKNIQNDYVKFIRYSELRLNNVGLGVLGFITSHAYLTNRTLRGMRESLLESFDAVCAYNLHGNLGSGEARALSDNDQNVFDISEGVAIVLMRKRHPNIDERSSFVAYADLAGSRRKKYDLLLNRTSSKVSWQEANPSPPLFLLRPDSQTGLEFSHGSSIGEVFCQYSAGIITARDAFATDISRNALIRRVEAFAKSSLRGQRLLQAFEISEKKGWDVDVAKRQASNAMPLRKRVKQYLYRPFDRRFIAYTRGIVWGMAFPTLRHTLGGNNVVLIAMKQYQYDIPEYCYVFVSRGLTDSRIFVSKTGVASLFPLYLHTDDGPLSPNARQSANLNADFTDALAEGIGLKATPVGRGDLVETVGSDDILHFIYGQLHSPTYRNRFSDQLRSDYPRVFPPNEAKLFCKLCQFGADLVALHLLEDDYEAASWNHPDSRVESPLDHPITEFVTDGEPEVARGYPKYDDGRVYVNSGCWFDGVSEAVWNFHIGGYQVCHKWLKDRGPKKGDPGRVLSVEDIAHYQKIVVALNETIRLMAEIDEVIDAHGGWPDAFITGKNDSKSE